MVSGTMQFICGDLGLGLVWVELMLVFVSLLLLLLYMGCVWGGGGLILSKDSAAHTEL